MSTSHRNLMAVLAFDHPLGAVTSVAERMAAGLACQGLEARVLTLPRDAEALARLPRERVAGILSLGPVPLGLRVGGQPLWQHFDQATVSVYLLDALIYDLARVPATREFLTAAANNPRLSLLAPEAGYRDWLGAALPVAWRYLPFAAFPHLALPGTPEAAPVEPQSRFCVIGTIGGELGGSPVGESLSALLQRLLGRQVAAPRLQQAQDALLAADAHPLPARTLAASLGLAPADVLAGGAPLTAAIAVDSWFKRERRLAAVRSLAGLPVDFFGTGWQALLGDVPGFRHVGQIQHGDIARLLPHYLGLVNFDPNWQHGVHDRVYTATAIGGRVITNHNSALDEACLPAERVLRYDANRPALAEAVVDQGWLDSLPLPARPDAALLARHTWGTRMAQWLAAEPIEPGALPAPVMQPPAQPSVQPAPVATAPAVPAAVLHQATHQSVHHPLMHTLATTGR